MRAQSESVASRQRRFGASPITVSGATLRYLLMVFLASAATNSAFAEHPGPAEQLDPAQVLGNDACVKCHASEVQTWKRTPHARTFDELHRRPEAQSIATKLGLQSIKHEGRCSACHYTERADASGHHRAIAGISCESCHGAGKNWVDLHHDYGGEGLTRLTETDPHRRDRIAKSIAAGMRNPTNVYLVAQSCLRCHTTADEELVNVGGHSAGSLDFEFVSWSQGTIRHNFVRSDGKSNDISSPERIRLMFVAGIIAELEASLRATAVATEKATFGITAAKRAARSAARVKSIADKIDAPSLDRISVVFDSISLKLNNREELVAAANEVAQIGFEFAATNRADLSPLDPFIPTAERYK